LWLQVKPCHSHIHIVITTLIRQNKVETVCVEQRVCHIRKRWVCVISQQFREEKELQNLQSLDSNEIFSLQTDEKLK
jgi:hypothetical protein